MKQGQTINEGTGGERVEIQENVDRKTEILNKALTIFVKYGYRKTTIEDIGKACGLGKAALYHYFASKEEILSEVLRRESERLLEQIRLAVDATDDPKAKLVAMVTARFKFIKEFIFGKNIVKTEVEELLPLAAKVRQSYFQKETKILEDILEEGQAKGVFKKLNGHTIPLLIISAFKGIEVHFAEVQDAPALETGVDEMLKMVFEGICV